MSDGIELPRKEGIEYLHCEHLDNGSMKDEISIQWIGEKKRIVLCAICFNQHLGLFLRLVAQVHGLDQYEPEPEEIKPIEDGWVDKLFNFFSPRVTITKMDYNAHKQLAYLEGQKDAFDYAIQLAEEAKAKEEQNHVAHGE